MLIATVTASVAKLTTTNPSALPINIDLRGGGAIIAVYASSSSSSGTNSSSESKGISYSPGSSCEYASCGPTTDGSVVGAICVASAAAGAIIVASAAAGAIIVAAPAGYSSAVCAAPRAIAKPASAGTSTGAVERSSAATESRSKR